MGGITSEYELIVNRSVACKGSLPVGEPVMG